MGNSQSRPDLCLYYTWSHDGLEVWFHWIDGNILGNKNCVKAQQKKLLEKFQYMEEGEWKNI